MCQGLEAGLHAENLPDYFTAYGKAAYGQGYALRKRTPQLCDVPG